MNLTTRDMTEIAVLTALISVTSWISIPIGDIPITIQTLVVMLIGLFLSPKNSFISILAYIIIGAMGLPVFAGGKGGFGIILGPSGGFLISFIFAVIFISKMKNIKIINNEIVRIVVVLVFANIIIYMIGWTYFAVYNGLGIATMLAIIWPFAIGDMFKIVVVTYVYLNMRSHVTYERLQI
jgi:biotin transport system substrate-specific component